MGEGPAEIWFYHLERTGLEQVLPELLEKTLARGWRALVRSVDADRLARLDAWLWTYREDSFLPHGLAGETAPERQPILLTGGQDNTNGAQALFVLDEAPADISSYARCMVVFDGHDEAALARARSYWKTCKTAGLNIAYWKQGESRGWERQG